ncbi:MAG: hypothetical protein ACRD4G_04685 [Bryobacteraceae bacterium]
MRLLHQVSTAARRQPILQEDQIEKAVKFVPYLAKRAAFGLLLGIPLAIGAGRLISSQLYGVADWDPVALAIAASSLALCAFFAALRPARRAASIEPMKALRVE